MALASRCRDVAVAALPCHDGRIGRLVSEKVGVRVVTVGNGIDRSDGMAQEVVVLCIVGKVETHLVAQPFLAEAGVECLAHVAVCLGRDFAVNIRWRIA